MLTQPISVGAASGSAAQAKILFPVLGAAGDTITINGYVFTLGTDFQSRAVPSNTSPAAFNDRAQAATAASLANAIRTRGGLGFTAYAEGPVLYVVSLATGTGANSWAVSTSNSTAFTVPSTFSGGA